MARIPHNIELSAFRPREYVGYARGVWRIMPYGRKGSPTSWRAAKMLPGNPYGVCLAEMTGRTLAEISAKLEAHKAS